MMVDGMVRGCLIGTVTHFEVHYEAANAAFTLFGAQWMAYVHQLPHGNGAQGRPKSWLVSLTMFNDHFWMVQGLDVWKYAPYQWLGKGEAFAFKSLMFTKHSHLPHQ